MNAVDDCALWFGEILFQQSGSPARASSVRQIRRKLASGSSLDEVKRATAARQPNDFGMTIFTAAITFIVLEALKAFWSSYLKKLTDGLATDAAEITMNMLRKPFLEQLRGPASQALLDEIDARLDEEARRHEVDLKEIQQVKAALRDPALLAAAIR